MHSFQYILCGIRLKMKVNTAIYIPHNSYCTRLEYRIRKRFEDTKRVIRSRKQEKTDNTMAKRKKKINNDIYNSTQKTKDRTRRTPLKSEFLSGFSRQRVAANKEATESRVLLDKLKSSVRNFDGRHHDSVDRYGISVSQMTTDMFHLS